MVMYSRSAWVYSKNLSRTPEEVEYGKVKPWGTKHARYLLFNEITHMFLLYKVNNHSTS